MQPIITDQSLLSTVSFKPDCTFSVENTTFPSYYILRLPVKQLLQHLSGASHGGFTPTADCMWGLVGPCGAWPITATEPGSYLGALADMVQHTPLPATAFGCTAQKCQLHKKDPI